MATYKFYTTASNCGIIEDQAGGVTAMPAQGMYVKSAGNIAVLYSSDPFAPSIQAFYSDVLKSDNSPCASVTEAVEYIGGIIRSVASGGGGGGSATAANQTNGNQKTQVVDNVGASVIGAVADSPSTAPAANKSMIAVIKGFWQTFGEQTDTALATPATTGTLMGVLRGIWTKLNASVAVTGTFWQTTQPVSAASLPLPTGAATSNNQTNGQQISNPTPFTYLAPVNVSTAAVGTTVFVVSAANSTRRGFSITNKTNNTVYINIDGSTPVRGTGATALYHYAIAAGGVLTVTNAVCSAEMRGIFATNPNGNGLLLTQLT